jgi:hypothetical protein
MRPPPRHPRKADFESVLLRPECAVNAVWRRTGERKATFVDGLMSSSNWTPLDEFTEIESGTGTLSWERRWPAGGSPGRIQVELR